MRRVQEALVLPLSIVQAVCAVTQDMGKHLFRVRFG